MTKSACPTLSGRPTHTIERIGSDALALPGVERIEWHESLRPDGHFWRLPLPGIVLVFNVGVLGEYRLTPDDPWHPLPRASIRGLCTRPMEGRDPPTGSIGYVSVVLAPWALPSYVGVSAADLRGCIGDLATLRDDTRPLLDALLHAPNGTMRLRLVAQWLRERVSAVRIAERSVTARVEHALRAGEEIGAIGRSIGRSARWVHLHWTRHAGVSPSEYRQLVRFATHLESLHREPAACPFEAGYADQSHAIRTFRRFAGVTPGRYRREVAGERAYSIVRIP